MFSTRIIMCIYYTYVFTYNKHLRHMVFFVSSETVLTLQEWLTWNIHSISNSSRLWPHSIHMLIYEHFGYKQLHDSGTWLYYIYVWHSIFPILRLAPMCLLPLAHVPEANKTIACCIEMTTLNSLWPEVTWRLMANSIFRCLVKHLRTVVFWFIYHWSLFLIAHDN